MIIFSRMGSSRLPGKAIRDIGGRTLLGRVIDRARCVRRDIEIVVATSECPEDEEIVAFAKAEQLPSYRGELDNVAARALACCCAFEFTRFVRVCGDRPFMDPGMIESLLDRAELEDLDLATNAQEKTFPAGLTTEVIKTKALETIIQESDDPEDLEHVTPYFYKHPEKFSIYNLVSQTPEDRDLNLALDTELDLDRARWMVAQFSEPAAVNFQSLVAAARAWSRL